MTLPPEQRDLRTSTGLLASNLALVLPFVLVGVVLGGLQVARFSLAVPVATQVFPAEGVVSLSSHFFPRGSATVGTAPAMVQGLKPPYLALLLGKTVLETLVVALGTAVFCWRATTGSWLPPVRSLGWLASYALAVAALSIGTLLAASVAPSITVVVALLALPLSVLLFLTPAVVVLDGVDPIQGVRRAAGLFTARPLRLGIGVLVLSYVGNVLTGVVTLVDGSSPLAFGLGTALSTAVAGTLLAALLVTGYESTVARSESAADPSGVQATATDD